MQVTLDFRYIRKHPSGIGTYASALLHRLPHLSGQDSLRVWLHPEAPSNLPKADNVTYVSVSAPANGFRTLIRPYSLDNLSQSDVFHSPHNLLGFNVPCASVVTVHDVMWFDRPDLIDAWWAKRMGRQLFFRFGIKHALHHANKIVTVSKASADAITRISPSSLPRVHVIHNAVEPEFRPPADRDQAKARAAQILANQAPYYLVVGANHPSKRHQDAIRAFSMLPNKHAHLVIVQRRHAKQGLTDLVHELGITDRVVWKSCVNTADLITLYQAADAFIHPSLAEGFGLPVLEAMACGCPVIAYDIAAVREVIEKSGVLVNVGNVQALLDAWRKVTENPNYASELRMQGLERARAFSWEKNASQTLEVYRDAARENVRASAKTQQDITRSELSDTVLRS